MVATEVSPRVVAMAEPGTKTVRTDSEIANMLFTTAQMKTQMGQRFKTVEFVNNLLRKAVKDVYNATLREFVEFNAAELAPEAKPPKRPKA